MRAAQAIEFVAAQVRNAFDDDVAEAIVGDAEMFEVAARHLGQQAGTTEKISAVVEEIAGDTDDGLADWLVERADSPGGWFYRQVTDNV
jgi:hypothetical protein